MSEWVPGAGPLWRERPEVRFPLRFVALSALMAAIWVALTPAWPALTSATAEVVAYVARLSGLEAVVQPGAHVAFNDGERAFSYSIIDQCTGLMLLMIYTAAVLAYPATARQRSIGLAVGLPLLLLANFVRLVALAWVGLHAPARFEALHQYWAQALLLALIGVAWFGWVWFVAKPKQHPTTRNDATTDGRSSQAGGDKLARRTVLHVGAFLGVVAVLGLVGLTAHGIAIWGKLVRAPAMHLAPLMDLHGMGPVSPDAALAAHGLSYSAFAAVVALFLVTPAVPWRVRIEAALLTGMPAVLLVQVTTSIMVLVAVDASRASGVTLVAPFLQALTLPLAIGFPAIVWHRWMCRARETEPR